MSRVGEKVLNLINDKNILAYWKPWAASMIRDITLVCPIMGTSSPLTGLRHAWTSGLEDSGGPELGMNVRHEADVT